MKSLQLFTLCFMMVVCSPSFATIINVPGDTTTIKGGIALANFGDTVLVAPGIYYESSIHITKSIVVGSYFITIGDTTFIDSTIVDGNAQSQVFFIDKVLVISGFTIRNGRGYGGIWVRGDTDGSPIITHNIITGNQNITDYGGGGILTWLGHTTIRNNKINNNHSDADGGGICVSYYGQATISDNIISNNTAAKNGGGIATDVSGLGATITGNTISHNEASFDGAGIACQDTVGSVIQNNLISDNSSNHYGGGICCKYDANPVIKENNIIGNSAMWGSAIECTNNSNPDITNNIIADHSVIYTIQLISCSPLLRNNTFYNNSSGAVLQCSNSDAIIINNLMVSNMGTAISSSASNLTITNNDFFNHQGDLFSGDMPSGIGVLAQTNANGDSCDAYANIFLDPLLADATNGDFQITWANWPVWDSTRSPAIDAGDPTKPLDPDYTISDMGALYFNQMHPFISASDSLLDFGKVIIGESADLSLTLLNSGMDTLEIIAISHSQSVFSHNWSPGSSQILPGDSLVITITFTPADTNLVLDTLRIENNDRPLEVRLSGRGEAAVGITNDAEELPKVYALYPAYPNPFNPSTTIEFDLPKYSLVELKVYNILGEEVSTLISKEMVAGRYKYIWNAGNLASGIYLYRLSADQYSKVRKIILVR